MCVCMLSVYVHLTTDAHLLVFLYSSLCVDEWKNFSMGYKEFMHELFDENLLFLEGKLCILCMM